ncbi:MAG: DUF2267 domain-containing protein [Gemmataceae bacterium]
MSHTGLRSFDSTIQTTNTWLHEIMEEMGWEDRHRAYHALRAVLHALRDQFPVTEAVALGAQLPLLVRGIYYDGWQVNKVPLRERKIEAFLAHVGQSYEHDPDIDLERVTKVVFRVLANHVDRGEVEGIRRILAQDLRTLWPEEC